MNYTYSLRISCADDKIDAISKIIGLKSNCDPRLGWNHYLLQKEQDPYIDFINIFLDHLDGNYGLLLKLGVEKKDISIWMIYEYDGQCNMEFLPKDMKR